MNSAEYEKLKKQLNTLEDVERLHQKTGLSKDMLYNILGRKIVRKVMKRYYIVKRMEGELIKRWNRGESIVEIARDIDFQPVLIASFILRKKGFSRKAFRKAVEAPDSLTNPRLRDEIKEAVKLDFVYSPWAQVIQEKNGKKAEMKIQKWLQSKGILFMTERESRIAYSAKTPDFILREPFDIKGSKIKWIESKASFGSPNEMKRNYRKQLKPYLDHFGPGMVVYWYGFVTDVKLDNRLLVVNEKFFKG